MKAIPLTKAKIASINNHLYETLSRHKWYAKKGSCKWYACRNVTIDGVRQTVYMHRFIMELLVGRKIDWSRYVVDHKDGNSLNNCVDNLRLCTHRSNAFNRGSSRGISKYKGVSWNRQTQSWFARITVDGKSSYLGSFESEEEAALAYDKAAKRLHKQYARLNFSH